MTACWTWIKSKDSHGYGVRFFSKGWGHAVYRKRVHKAVWEEINGALSGDMELHHLCKNKACYRPSHLMAMGRLAHMAIEKDALTTCRRGHDPLRTKIDKRGFRVCQDCRNFRQKARRLIIAALFTLSLGYAAAADDAAPKRPEWCRPGWICLTTSEVADATVHTIVLEREVALLKARKRPLLGIRYSCGFGAAAVATDQLDVKVVPAIACTVGFGF